MTQEHHSLIILGSGPAGCTAGIYAARANLNTAIITGSQPGGQLTTTSDIENWPGDRLVNGIDLTTRMMQHAEGLGVNMIYDTIQSVELQKPPFTLNGEKIYTCDALIIATGASPKTLGLPSEKTYLGKGVSICATCDGYFYKGKPAAIIGGGNAAVSEALYLSNLVSHLTLIHRRDQLRAEKVLIDQLKGKDNVTIEWFNEVEEILGDDNGVNGIKIKNNRNGNIKTIDVKGVFIAIGHSPNTKIFEGQLELVKGYIKIKEGLGNQATAASIDGIFAAGDVANYHYRQAIVASASGCMAAYDVEHYLNNL